MLTGRTASIRWRLLHHTIVNHTVAHVDQCCRSAAGSYAQYFPHTRVVEFKFLVDGRQQSPLFRIEPARDPQGQIRSFLRRYIITVLRKLVR